MKAIVQTGKEQVVVEEMDPPEPEAEEVLVRVGHAGVCGSDVHAYLMLDGFEWIRIPRVMGHEYAGEVVETGPDVTKFEAGDVVVESPIHPCGRCHQCEIGEENVCVDTTITGMHTDGAYREFLAVHEDHLVRIPDRLDTSHAALTEPLSIAARAIYDRSTVTPGDNVIVQGPGPIGVLTAALLDSLGAEVVVSGIQRDTAYRLPLAENLGIPTVNIETESLGDYVDAMTEGVGVDAVVDTTGHHVGIEGAVDLVRKGGEIVVVGLPGDSSDLFFSPIVRAELDIKASYGATTENFKQAVRTLDGGHIDAERIIDTRYEVENVAEAFDAFLASETCKPILSF